MRLVSSKRGRLQHIRSRDYAFPIDRATHDLRIIGLTTATAVPANFAAAIEASRALLNLGTDWDDEGAAAIEFATWSRATKFLRTTVAKSRAGAALAVPNISACRDGSIDLFWATTKFRLLINIKPSPHVESDYYGETADRLVIKGTFQPEIHDLSVVIKLLLDNI